MKTDNLISEARAKIIWGDSPESVRAFLVVGGMPEDEADEWIDQFKSERYAEIRAGALKKTVIGGVLVLGVGILFLAALQSPVTSGAIKGLVVAGAVGLYGIWQLIDGIITLVRPQTEERSIPDLTEE